MKIGDRIENDSDAATKAYVDSQVLDISRNINYGVIGEIVVDSNLPQGELTLNKQTNHEIKCECGSDVARLGTHSDYCPKYNLNFNLPTSEDDDRLPF